MASSRRSNPSVSSSIRTSVLGSGKPDKPENYHTVTVELYESNGHTRVMLAQDKNKTLESRAHSENNWHAMLNGLKKLVEARSLAFKR